MADGMTADTIGPEVVGYIDERWESVVLPALADYTRIPCLSPAYDPDWEAQGAIGHAARLLRDWCAERPVRGLQTSISELPGRTPVLVVDVPATDTRDGSNDRSGDDRSGDDRSGEDKAGTAGAPHVLVYGHLDKQPPQGEWRAGLGPYEPVFDGDRLFGRGTADDGYSVFAAVTAIEAMEAAGIAHPRVTVLIEASEESGSPDLDAHLEVLAGRLGRPDLVICLDSGALTYDRLWTTTSLRGVLVGTLRVDVLHEGVHSGLAGGVVPSSFRILRQLLSRIEDERTGRILLPELSVPVPDTEREALAVAAAVMPDGEDLPTVDGLRVGGHSAAERLALRAWTPALAITGIDGVPSVRDGGNVLRPFTTAKISLRLPPTCDAAAAAAALRAVLESDPPEGAMVTVELEPPASGWAAPHPAPWVALAMAAASQLAFGNPPGAYGEGGTIPFLPTLGERFPGVQLVATGVLGPHSNAHGPNEFLHLPMARAVTLAVVHLLAAAQQQGARA
jgi:acetylornithine deacetylase/succinyl-diaminopimelate desuccinylase-like protein